MTTTFNNHQISLDNDVAKTLLIPLYMRYKESNRKDNFFFDQIACQLVDKLDYDFSIFDKATRSTVGCALRAKYFDEVTTALVNKSQKPIVVQLGCGLDSRHTRMAANIDKEYQFYNLDLDEVIDLREKIITDPKNVINIKSSMFDLDWMQELKTKHPQADFIFVIEGVLMYFSKSQVKNLFINLANIFSNSNILCDVTSSWMVKNSRRHDAIKHTNCNFKLALDNLYEVEEWSEKISLIKTKHFTEFKQWKLTGVFKSTIMRLIPNLNNACRLVYYHID